jgi:hypothetical protein
MTKSELIDMVLTDDEKRNIDTALPQNFVDDCINLLDIDPRKHFVWSYMTDKLLGEPLNLAELLVERQGKRIANIDYVVKLLQP